MSEANNNATSFSSEFNLDSSNNNHQQENPEVITDNSPKESEPQNQSKMNWQKIAHKLRDYNRKLNKQVLRLEQEIAEIDNRFNKYVEKSRSNDLLVAEQEAKIQTYQEQVALLTQHLAASHAQINSQEATIDNLTEQHELSQQQTARLERDCTLLQESYSQKSYELIAKEKEVKNLQEKFNQQQRCALQYKAELKRYQEKEKTALPLKEPAANTRQNYHSNRSIPPWSTSTFSEPKNSLSKKKAQSTKVTSLNFKSSSETNKTAAQTATWGGSQLEKKQNSKTTNKSKSSKNGKPKSLADIDLLTFSRPV